MIGASRSLALYGPSNVKEASVPSAQETLACISKAQSRCSAVSSCFLEGDMLIAVCSSRRWRWAKHVKPSAVSRSRSLAALKEQLHTTSTPGIGHPGLCYARVLTSWLASVAVVSTPESPGRLHGGTCRAPVAIRLGPLHHALVGALHRPQIPTRSISTFLTLYEALAIHAQSTDGNSAAHTTTQNLDQFNEKSEIQSRQASLLGAVLAETGNRF